MDNRRVFLKQMAGLTGAMLLPVMADSAKPKPEYDRVGELLPLRKLGNTGKKVTMLGVGGYHIGWTSERDAQEVMEVALEGGVRFFDSAESYGPHTSEIRMGKYLTPQYRDLIFLMTKTQAFDAKTARQHLEDSLRRLNTDYLDLWQVHSLYTPEDVDTRAQQGVLDVMREAKASGKVRHIGFTGHQDPAAHLRILEITKDENLFETVQMPVNVVDMSYHSFTRQIMPIATQRKMGILAMKTLADGRFFASKVVNDREVWTSTDPVVPGRVYLHEALFFAWSLPVSTLITGAENARLMREKIQIARQFTALKAKDRDKLIDKVADLASDGKVEYYKKIEA
ncbi:MAG: aldo/keto reductase [Cyclobacteriaceae bacterium]|nr:aldo/keto reductase [Cyclobacteriaceae bacterium]